ncbi:hypothetical protein AB0L06_03875 [Spirillospora sp. NPDC052269]
MPPLEPAVARPVGAVLFVLLGSIQFLLVPVGFEHASYVGVCLILAMLMSLGGSAGFLADTRSRMWWYALTEGVANVLGVTYAMTWGMPLAEGDIGEWGRWARLLPVLSALLALLSVWALWSERHRRLDVPPVTSALERHRRPRPRHRSRRR